jgi:metal-responsive CopG/Arc/MetJ family transcriptional regulator
MVKREAAPDDRPIIPEGEGPLSEAITIRVPKLLLERIKRAAEQTHNNRTDTIQHLLRDALSRHEERMKGKKR